MVTRFEIHEALLLPESGERLIQVAVSQPQDGQATVRVFSQDGKRSWKQHATAIVSASVRLAAEVETLESIGRLCIEEMKPCVYYQRMANAGLAFGPSFRGYILRLREGEALAHVKLPQGLPASGYLLHPALLDSCLHVVGATLPRSSDNT